MGLPINKLICASNSNNVIDDFIRTGIYNKNRDLYKSMSPSMDILVSSNLERLLYHLTEDNDEKVSECMKRLEMYGEYRVDDLTKSKIQNLFYSNYCNEEETSDSIKDMFDTEYYLCDPHTAVAVGVYKKYVLETNDKDTPTIIASTASPYKFSEDVLSSISDIKYSFDNQFEVLEILSKVSNTKIPKQIENLRNKNIVFRNTCDKNSILDVILKYLNLNIKER